MQKVHVLIGTSLEPALIRQITQVDPRLHVEDVAALLLAELPSALRPGQKPPPPTPPGASLQVPLQDAEVLLAPRRLPLNLLARAPKLKWVQATQAGIDALEGTGVLESQVLLTTASGIHAIPVGEYILTAMLALAKQVSRLVEDKQGKQWDRFNLFELHGKTVGIVGLGNIGRAVARLCKAFDMRVIAVRRSATAEQLPTPEVDEVRSKEALRWLLQESDFVVLCVPLTSETTYLIGAEELKAMKPSAYLINVARGPVVEEKALIAALKEGQIAGAGLDVFTQEPLPPESELWELPNVFLSAHIAGLSEQYDTRVTQLFCENLRRYLAGQELLNLVDRSMGY